MNPVLKSVLQGIASFLIGALLTAYALFSCAAEGQTLTRAEAPFDATPLLLLAVAAAAVGGLIYLRRKNPAKFKQVVDQAKDVAHTIGDGQAFAEAKIGQFQHAFEAFVSEHKVPPALHLPPTNPAVTALAAARANLMENARANFPNGFEVVEPPPAAPPAAAIPAYLLDNRSLKA